MRTLAVVYNPTKIGNAGLRKVVEPAQQAAGWAETLWFETSVEDPGTELTREAVQQGADVVLAVGGDGTIRAVAEGLRGTGVPVALAPRGTGNLLARNLELTLDNLEESVRVAFHGRQRAVDLGVAQWSRPGGEQGEAVFVVAAGVGLDATIMSTTDEALKKKVGMFAYIKAGFEALLTNHRMHVSYRLDDDDPGVDRMHTILIGNCGSIGGNVLLLPDAAVDDGVLDVVAILPRGLFGWPRVAWKVLVDNWLLRRTRSEFVRKQRDRSRELNYQQCREISVQFRDPEEVQLDGDVFGRILTLRVTVQDGGLLVQLP